MKKSRWTRTDKLTAAGVALAVAAIIAAFVIPECRRLVGLDKPVSQDPQTASVIQPTQSTEPPAPNVTPSNLQPRPATPEPVQKAKTKVNGNSNIAGNNVAGNNNVVGNGNRTAPTAIAPNGIAISGGNVSNPTVNNITALPDVTMSDSQEKQISDSIGDLFAGADVTVTAVQPDQNTRDVSDRLTRVFKSKGANVEYDTVQMFLPAAGMTLHKGVSITAFPSERKAAVDTFVESLGNAGVVKIVPIYDRRDKKVEIVVNRSADTREEAKQY